MPMEQDDGASAPIPRVGKKQLRACMLCSVVLEATEFKKRGCPNCEDVLQVRHDHWVFDPAHGEHKLHNDSERVAACTSAQFEGMIALVNPTESWVARWQRIGETEIRGPRSL